jgi:hypothetical protein
MLLDAGDYYEDDGHDVQKEFLLKENERLVGFKANSNKMSEEGKGLFDFVFVICRQE